jgi:hypothetical protein
VDPNAWRLVFLVPMIVGLVELARRAGLGPVACSALAVTLGLGVRLGYAAASGTADLQGWLDATLQGLTIGLVAAGLAAKIRQAGEGRA